MSIANMVKKTKSRRALRAAKRSAAKRALARAVARAKPRGGPCFCYIVECSDGTLYTGWAVDAEKRLKAHNSGRGASYTKTRRPVKLVYVEPQPDYSTAMKRELAIKSLTREKKLALIEGR